MMRYSSISRCDTQMIFKNKHENKQNLTENQNQKYNEFDKKHTQRSSPPCTLRTPNHFSATANDVASIITHLWWE